MQRRKALPSRQAAQGGRHQDQIVHVLHREQTRRLHEHPHQWHRAPQGHVCDPDERCAPCINPQNGEDTKICEDVGVYETACTGGGGSNDELCCHGQGVCANQEAIPEDSRSDMEKDSCSGNKLCAPAALVDGHPVKCDVAGVEGVCLDYCFAKMMQGTARLMRGGCRATEVCLPCFLGKSRGMPGCE
jgi:hypothetical protein